MNHHRDPLERKLRKIVDSVTLPENTHHIQYFDGRYRWQPLVNFDPEDQYFFDIEEAYRKEYDEQSLASLAIKKRFDKLNADMDKVNQQLRFVLFKIMECYIPKYYPKGLNNSGASYYDVLNKGLKIAVERSAIGTPFQNIAEANYFKNYATIFDSDIEELTALHDERDTYLKKGLSLITENPVTIYGYYQHFVLSEPTRLERINSQDKSGKDDHKKHEDWIHKVAGLLKNEQYPPDEELADSSIKEEIEEVPGKRTSDNRVAKQIVILYEHKFGYSIGNHTVKRYAGFIIE